MNAITSLIKRLTSGRGSGATRTGGRETTAAGSPRDFAAERETGRVGDLSEEDQAWEAASLARNREAQGREKTPSEDG